MTTKEFIIKLSVEDPEDKLGDVNDVALVTELLFQKHVPIATAVVFTNFEDALAEEAAIKAGTFNLL